MGNEPVRAAQQRALARARGSDDEDHLAGRDVEVDVGEGDRSLRVGEADGLVHEVARRHPGVVHTEPLELFVRAADDRGHAQREQREDDEWVERREPGAVWCPGERVVAGRTEDHEPERRDENCGHDAAVERGQAARPVAHPARRARCRRDRADEERDTEPTRDRGGRVCAADQRDECSAQPEQAAERPGGRDALAPPGGPVTKTARVHRLRERDRAFHAALEHGDGMAYQSAPPHDRATGPGPVGLSRRAEGGEGRRDERERDRDDQTELVERAWCRLQDLVM